MDTCSLKIRLLLSYMKISTTEVMHLKLIDTSEKPCTFTMIDREVCIYSIFLRKSRMSGSRVTASLVSYATTSHSEP